VRPILHIFMTYRFRISKRLFDISLTQEDITARNSPQHALKSDDSFTVDDTCNEPQLLRAFGRWIALCSFQVG
jgi:hypothetical protein